MYKKLSVLESPQDEKAKIWRYLDFTKFVSLIDRESLFFQRLDKLGDPFEGSITQKNIDHRQSGKDEEMAELLKARGIDTRVFIKSFITDEKLNPAVRRRCAVVNCWHINDFESAAMWKLYLKSDEGVAIQSTFEMLKQSFAKYEENDVYIGKVKYIDYQKEMVPYGNRLYPFVFKRQSFQHENELRAIICKFPAYEENVNLNFASFESGIYVPVDLQELIDKIYVSPTSEKWFSDLVKSIADKYNLRKKVVKSSLADDPLF